MATRSQGSKPAVATDWQLPKCQRKISLPEPPANDASLLEWALFHGEFGRLTGAYKVFRLKPGDKPPFRKGWQAEATTDPSEIKAWWRGNPKCNIGLAIQKGFKVVDDDGGLQDFEDNQGHELPPTLEQNTANDGVHLFYATDRETGNSTGDLPRGIDMRGHGGYVVGAGSVLVKDGKKVGRWSLAETMPPVPLPEWFEKHLRVRKTSKDKPRTDYGEPADHDWRRANVLIEEVRAGRAIKEYEGEFYDGSRNTLTYKLFASAKGWMIHPDVMLEVILGDSITGGLDSEEVESICQSVFYDGNTQDPYGYKIWAFRNEYEVLSQLKVYKDGKPIGPAPLPDPIEWKAIHSDRLPDPIERKVKSSATSPSVVEDDADTGSVIGFDALLQSEPQPVSWLLHDWIEKGIPSLLSGVGGSHKSRLALQLGLCIQAGQEVLGQHPEQATFVYVSCEDPWEEVQRRTHAISDRLDLSPSDLVGSMYVDRFGKPSAIVEMREGGEFKHTDFHKELGEMLCKISGHKFVVVDSAYDFARFRGNSKIDEDAVNVYFKQVLTQFGLETDSTLLLPWHPSYSGQERGDGSGWSVAWHNAPRSRNVLKKNDKSQALTLEGVKRNHSKLPEPLTLYYDNGALISPTLKEIAELRALERNAVLALIAELRASGQTVVPAQGNGVKVKELPQMLEKHGFRLTAKEVEAHIKELISSRQLHYMPASPGKRGKRATYNIGPKTDHAELT